MAQVFLYILVSPNSGLNNHLNWFLKYDDNADEQVKIEVCHTQAGSAVQPLQQKLLGMQAGIL